MHHRFCDLLESRQFMSAAPLIDTDGPGAGQDAGAVVTLAARSQTTNPILGKYLGTIAKKVRRTSVNEDFSLELRQTSNRLLAYVYPMSSFGGPGVIDCSNIKYSNRGRTFEVELSSGRNHVLLSGTVSRNGTMSGQYKTSGQYSDGQRFSFNGSFVVERVRRQRA